MTHEWTFKRRQASCGTCDRPYADGERHVSVLSVREGELAREDVCDACWSTRESQVPAPDTLYYWFTRYSVDKKKLRLDLATLEELFVRLEGRTEERVAEIRYVLCLLLMRKRRVKLDRVVRGAAGSGARERMIVKRPRREEALEVVVFDFTPERSVELRDEIVRLLEGVGTELAEALSAPAVAPASAAEATIAD